MINRIIRNSYWLLLILWIAMHIPFLSSDPDTLVDIHTRGAWTDEGLYAGTARNFINTGYIDPYENSLLTRNPLQTIVQIPVFFVFGQSIIVARILTLFVVSLAFFFLLRRRDTVSVGIILLTAGFTQFHLFHFSHYAMAEAMSTAMIMMALVCIVRVSEPELTKRRRYSSIAGAAALLFAAYSFKIQFLYIAVMLPAYTLFNWLYTLFTRHHNKGELRDIFLVSTAFTVLFALVYVIAWYLPNREFYHFVMSREVDSRFPDNLKNIFGQAGFNFTELIFVPYLKPLIVTAGTALVAGISWLLIRPGAWRPAERILFVSSLIWFILEIHKAAMTYMPHRYLVPAYTSIAVMMAVVLAVTFRKGNVIRLVTVILIALIAGWQLRYTHEAYMRRTRDLQTVNNYLKRYNWHGKTITGAWAPSVTWGTQARVFPVWYGFVNDHRAIDADMIITESDQDDSDRSLINRGIDLVELTDSTRRFKVWRYEVDLNWLKR